MTKECKPDCKACGFPAREIATWGKFKSFISDLLLQGSPPVQDRFLFRGHGSARWHLEPRFERTFQTLPESEAPTKHDLLLAHFREQCQYFPEFQSATRNEQELLALAQHHGLPTRLLDWSDSPYIAAYFAFAAHLSRDHGENQSGEDERVAVWVLDTTVTYYWDSSRGVEVRPDSWANERQRRQFGWFTYAKMPCANLEEYVLMGNEKNALQKLVLPASGARAAICDLDLMRINARELFADLNGAAQVVLLKAALANDLSVDFLRRKTKGFNW